MMTLMTSPAWGPARWAGRVVEARTGPLERLAGRKAVVLADLENLLCGARDLGYRIDLPALTERLRGAAGGCVLHAVFSARPEEAGPRRAELEALGWRVHVNPVETVRTSQGLQHKANGDNLLLFKAGSLFSRSRADCVVLASGDGDLVQTIAHGVRHHLDKRRDLLTLSLPGSTSHRLNADHNPLIAANLEIGRDCLTPLHREGGRHAPVHAR